ncbi:hypothetical protein KCMC57_up00620 [Kitasatospora sp. CMC57]|uniref:Uncharacterized protein n=1 Tax=Kitasatospora sp. CMC57 TaxID=3231513 RepID=A0AB33JQP5_9ACTN
MALGVLFIAGVFLLIVLVVGAAFTALASGPLPGRILRGFGLALLLVLGMVAVVLLPPLFLR